MKKSKSKALAKRAKKTAFKEIKIKLVNEVNEVTANLGKSSKKLRKIIAKESRKFAKKISKELKIKKTYLVGSDTNSAPINKPDTFAAKEVQPVVNSNPAAIKPLPKRARVKTAAPALPSTTKVKKAPVTRAKAVKKATEPVLKQ